MRLRDLAGLIVLDFIDMEDSKNDRNVEKRLHNAVRGDRARIQIGKISQFGLLEMSRQRLRAGVLAGSTVTCPHCNGQGLIRSTESAALRLLRALDEEGQNQPAANVTVKAPSDVTIYTLNQKRRELARIEEAYDLAISFDPQANMMGGSFELERTGVRIPSARPKALPVSVEAGFPEESEPEEPETDVTIVEAPVEARAESKGAVAKTAVTDGAAGERGDGDGRGRKRRRRRRGGRGRNGQAPAHDIEMEPRLGDSQAAPASIVEPGIDSLVGESLEGDDAETDSGAEGGGEERDVQGGAAPPPSSEADKHRRRRRRGRRGRRREGELGVSTGEAPPPGEPAGEPPVETGVFVVEPTPEGVPIVMPNAPSSPLWSLTDHAPEGAPALPGGTSPATRGCERSRRATP